MEQSLNNIAANSLYRICFKNIVGKHEREIGDSDKQAVVDCFTRLKAAFKIVSPAVFRSFEFTPAAEEGEEGEEAGEAEGGDDE